MKRSAFENILSFLLGVSWAFLLIGLSITFDVFSSRGIFTAVLASFIFLFLALFVILILEAIDLQLKKFKELQEQTKLLKQIDEKVSNNRPQTVS